MKFHQLQSPAFKKRRRAGRGIAAGRGKTAGRGMNGQKSRSGGNSRPFFEGGQIPLIRRLPKLAGFKSHRPVTQVIHTQQLTVFKTRKTVIDNHALATAGLIKDPFLKVKLIKKGDLAKGSYHLQIQQASQAAQAVVVDCGGRVEFVPRLRRSKADKNQKVVK